MNKDKDNRKQLGNYGENLALEAYEKAGYKLVAQQYRCSLGEIDLIVQKEEVLIFVEVRTKTNQSFGTAEESITEKKKRTIRKVSQFFLHDVMYDKYCKLPTVQFDVIAIYIDKQTKQAWIKRYDQAF
jgi:putative endonuclease